MQTKIQRSEGMLSLLDGSFSVCIFFLLLEALLLQPVSVSSRALSAVSDFKLPFAISRALPQIHYPQMFKSHMHQNSAFCCCLIHKICAVKDTDLNCSIQIVYSPFIPVNYLYHLCVKSVKRAIGKESNFCEISKQIPKGEEPALALRKTISGYKSFAFASLIK